MTYANVQTRRMPFAMRYVADLFVFRHLCVNLVASDLRSRFRRSSLGVLWAVIQPLSFSLMVAAVWGSMFKVANYWDFALYVFSGVIVWEYFGTLMNLSQDALTNAEGYLKQTRIPFIVFQIRTPLTAMVIFCFALIGLFILQASLQKLPPLGVHMALIPGFMGLFLLFGIPLSILMSLIGTLYRDVKYISQIAVQGLFFISPVMLERGVLNQPGLQFLRFLNPVVSILDLFRAPILRGEMWDDVAFYTLLAWIGFLWVAAIALSMKVGRQIVFAL